MASMGVPNQPPPYAAIPHGPPPQVVTIVGQPAAIIHTGVTPVVIGTRMGSTPAVMMCKSCNLQIETRVITKSTMKTHVFALILCLVGCWPCAFIPYCVDSCKSADHYCPNCSAYIGSYVN